MLLLAAALWLGSVTDDLIGLVRRETGLGAAPGAAVGGPATGGGKGAREANGSTDTVAPAGRTGTAPTVSAAALPPIADVVERVGPAVVRIDVEEATAGSGQLFDFFGNPLLPLPEVRRGTGSGFFISKDGLILTNNHVVSGADRIYVTVQGREQPLAATVVGTDPALDLAVLRVRGSGFPVVALGDSDRIRPGDWVIAVGNPYGLDHTVTVGVVSATGRPLQIGDKSFESLIQTDAAINPGNSGGPLLNLAGQVIGINTAVNAEAQGIGFAIPVNTARSVLDDLIKKGRVVRPWLGVFLQEVDETMAAQLGLPDSRGAIVAGVVPGGPADRAGVAPGDVIRQFDGRAVARPDDVTRALNASRVGQAVRLKVWRRGRLLDATVTLGERPRER